MSVHSRVCYLPLLLAPALLAQAPVRYDSGTISGLPARNIGSAEMSGRIAAVTAVNDSGRLTVFAASASGGVWKSINGGTTFKSVFDLPDVQSIGAVSIDPSNPKIVWVGTGESWLRNSVSVGDGVYKSSDGGQTWRKVLAGANGSTGCGMLSMAAQDPKTIYASMWDFRRQAWTFRSGGPGSGLFKSTDGGEHWTELTAANAKGLPEKPYGRIALAVAPSKPQVVYATIESKSSALYRSADGGQNWTRLDASQYQVWRPFYFANLIVDPKDENKVFKVDGPLLLSVNGGRSFSQVANAHGDFHDVWIDPGNSNVMFTGDDGGLWRSQDGGTRWEHLMTLPVSQFYHVSADNAEPYRVYGGLQDNSWPTRTAIFTMSGSIPAIPI